MDRMPPNLLLPTMGRKQIWSDRVVFAQHRVQRNVLTGHHRLLGPEDERLAWGTYEVCVDALERRKDSHALKRTGTHLVLVLHGIFRSKDSLSPMTRSLRRSGYAAEGVNYASTRRTLEEHADDVQNILETADGIDTVSFVCHSMGGLVARTVLGRSWPSWRERITVNRLVMIATPNQGSHMARRLLPFAPWQAIVGPPGYQLVPEYVRKYVPQPTCRFGLIAGVRGTGGGWNPLEAGEDDFTVAFKEIWLKGAEDVYVTDAIHTFVMVKPDVIRATRRYLETGRFQQA